MNKALTAVLVLSIVTICYNLAEGMVSVLFGFRDETLVLFGFGVDSFVEVISGFGILHMVLRMKNSPIYKRDRFERAALRVTGSAFYLLAAGLTAGAIVILATGTMPETTFWGIIVSAVSIVTMTVLIKLKMTAGKELGSEAVVADARCTRACLWLSFVLLASSIFYELLGVPFIDAAGSIGMAFLSLHEGREAFEKARTAKLSCGCGDKGETSL